jgi:membrane protease YdiL (CAAX protease family)
MHNFAWLKPIDLGQRRVLAPGRLLWLRAIVWLALSIFAIAFLFGLTSDLLGKAIPQDSGPLAFIARCSGPVVALAAYTVLVRLGEARRPAELGLKPAAPQLLVGLIIGTAMFATVMLILAGSGLYKLSYVGWAPAWQPAGAAIEAGIVEELMVRGLMFRLVWRAFGPAAAFLVSAAAFGVGHLGNENATAFAVICIALEAGVMLGAFYALTGRLWVSIGVHIAWNFAQGYLFGAVVSGESLGPSLAVSQAKSGYPEWLTGGPFGPEASLPALIVCSGIGAITLLWAWKVGHLDASAKAVPVRAGTGSNDARIVPSHR